MSFQGTGSAYSGEVSHVGESMFWECYDGEETERIGWLRRRRRRGGGEATLCKMWPAFFFKFFRSGGLFHIGVPLVLFRVKVSHRRFTENLLPPLATFPTTSLHHTTLVLICIRFTCPRCYSEGQEDGLVVPHADVGSNVIIDY